MSDLPIFLLPNLVNLFLLTKESQQIHIVFPQPKFLKDKIYYESRYLTLKLAFQTLSHYLSVSNKFTKEKETHTARSTVILSSSLSPNTLLPLFPSCDTNTKVILFSSLFLLSSQIRPSCETTTVINMHKADASRTLKYQKRTHPSSQIQQLKGFAVFQWCRKYKSGGIEAQSKWIINQTSADCKLGSMTQNKAERGRPRSKTYF